MTVGRRVFDELRTAIAEGHGQGLTVCGFQSAFALLSARTRAEQVKNSSALTLRSSLGLSSTLLLPQETFSVSLEHEKWNTIRRERDPAYYDQGHWGS